ncbi:hypothetical protein A3H80_02880 [Candidatus Roizmanbacteria bacterium RIFCSPLOWO2_02_FULL_37_19]|uniref:DUF2795 domain-containing protein n=1 Tax=Candidatus Roizmanbacteria bacterium RIFCSPHIGHO2_02_FULL_37_24 TaxID=1802037 RepID=A0A1F7GZF0_9BACT|nr:MAG: hypothetical protein A2862_03695 [Candidatus Roizmanbacteria bacterium RIFCSPHIGHO2_01_FULL_38_41]OGK24268.1 MAG: hypothetical protein A3C24_04175 [Candidatus Roizmanbacteria bacterium RIFCSPHIGHO2_02_FULL_37_24]OGK32176.1 MAG: hypothetical protein A3E10_03580 [Candidatus Roizmanbacteria bacterium RIFCSPHIGHO2_12_FULL_37_23]OGK44443.1 MAG: hypothetical protein A2956_01215 [Candidatus Roizmanbacteria bacterium RIFCSPLOWO2_01_FULL_37_57]OGK53805.1 MAG: hypothetical protein A3H80_02880 [Ca
MLDDATKQKIREHIATHHDGFPTTKAKLVEACNDMSDFSEDDKKWFMDTLPDGDYNSAEEVTTALGL